MRKELSTDEMKDCMYKLYCEGYRVKDITSIVNEMFSTTISLVTVHRILKARLKGCVRDWKKLAFKLFSIYNELGDIDEAIKEFKSRYNLNVVDDACRRVLCDEISRSKKLSSPVKLTEEEEKDFIEIYKKWCKTTDSDYAEKAINEFKNKYGHHDIAISRFRVLVRKYGVKKEHFFNIGEVLFGRNGDVHKPHMRVRIGVLNEFFEKLVNYNSSIKKHYKNVYCIEVPRALYNWVAAGKEIPDDMTNWGILHLDGDYFNDDLSNIRLVYKSLIKKLNNMLGTDRSMYPLDFIQACVNNIELEYEVKKILKG